MSAPASATIRPREPNPRPEDLVHSAASFRDRLLGEQEATEERGAYSPETHELFREAGFYRTLLPRRYGGYEFDVPTFLRVIVEIARGCPGTGWGLCLAAGHGLQIGGLYGEAAQSGAIGPHGDFAAPMRGIPMGTATRTEQGSWRIAGTWDYCSGSPYSTHAMLAVRLDEGDGATGDQGLALVPRADWTLMDDWRHRSFGMRGSGSNSIRVDAAVIPDEFLVRGNPLGFGGKPATPGYRLHGNPMYAGHSMGYLQLEITSVLVGCAYAALDEYERIIRAKRTPGPRGVPRFQTADYQRYWGLASGKASAAEDVLLRSSEFYMELCREAVVDDTGFAPERLMRIHASTHHAVNLAWEAVELLFRTSGTSEGGRNGSRMQRYYRDISTARTNVGLQWETFATALAQEHFGLKADGLV
ncbi:acyl-CoA dehydrogenase family protein [Streptomyces pseudovenezuelae]|uniref:3-hydroxy-9,10-secoandrosta-1,3,5(10)-triene-9, 17-dione monooxygenase n=1 Tax=Streptomyces pseudovenezuelae TaxID=67350 RepID=A0ABT6LT69_9ACTN|nr:acyl-CoA dehydrogenase family protein [Streptomyces pseudovenezuelae]MDH6219525.1 3-hydroxy-9,10-secoandrosta-1,3,5(10)-triene-9,17-dione monooxygenase [Streptomyces pseudovenezuelae]